MKELLARPGPGLVFAMIQKYREGRLRPSIDFRKSVAIHEQGLEAESVEMNGVANQASVAFAVYS